MTPITTHTNTIFETRTFFQDWSAPERLYFTPEDHAAVQRSFDDFKHGRTLSVEEVEASALAHIATFYEPQA